MTTYIHSFGVVAGDGDYEAVSVEIKTEITPGIGIHLVGLPDNRLKESLLRVATALQARGFSVPGKRITINVTPEVSKAACFLDLPIALGIIAASGQMELPGLDDYIIAGELGLDGSVRDVSGRYAIELARKQGKKCMLPAKTVVRMEKLSLVDGAEIHGVDTLDDALSILSGKA